MIQLSEFLFGLVWNYIYAEAIPANTVGQRCLSLPHMAYAAERVHGATTTIQLSMTSSTALVAVHVPSRLEPSGLCRPDGKCDLIASPQVLGSVANFWYGMQLGLILLLQHTVAVAEQAEGKKVLW